MPLDRRRIVLYPYAMLLFKKKFLAAIRAGEKTQTIRLWKHRRMRAGQRSYIPGIGPIRLTAVEEVDLDGLTDADARPDGFESAVELRAEISSALPTTIGGGVPGVSSDVRYGAASGGRDGTAGGEGRRVRGKRRGARRGFVIGHLSSAMGHRRLDRPSPANGWQIGSAHFSMINLPFPPVSALRSVSILRPYSVGGSY